MNEEYIIEKIFFLIKTIYKIAIFRVAWVFPLAVKEMLLSWHGPIQDKEKIKVWKTAPLCHFWTIWQECNNRAFDNKENPTHLSHFLA